MSCSLFLTKTVIKRHATHVYINKELHHVLFPHVKSSSQIKLLSYRCLYKLYKYMPLYFNRAEELLKQIQDTESKFS